MDRTQLKAWLDAGLSLPQIGALTNRDPSTVGYWVKKYGLTANGKERYAPRGGLTRAQLEPFVERGATLAEIADELDRSTSTVRHWLNKHGLSTTRRHENTQRAREALAAGQTRFLGTCRRHGETDFLVFKSGRHRCARCNSEAVARRRRRVKEALVLEAGGRCAICGYDRHPAALQFHHIDPDQKEFAVSNRGVTRAIAVARIEAQKCVLLCATCHAEVEAGAASLPAT
jgi:transposase